MKKLVSLIALVLLSSSLFSQAKMDSLFNLLESRNLSIGNIDISQNGQSIYNRDFGTSYRNMGSYHIGSITKMYTGIIVFKAIEEGVLKLDQTLDNYFPNIPNAKYITISNLVGHTSGLKDYVTKKDTLIYWLKKPATHSEIEEEIIRQGVAFSVGEGVKYSNSAYYLLTRILEKTYNKPYSEILYEKIIFPLKLVQTSSKEEGLSINKSYLQNTLGKWIETDDFCFSNVVGVGEVVSTPKELNHIISSLFAGKIIDTSSLKAMRPTTAKGTFGRGLMRIPFYDNIFLGHNGETYGTHSISIYNEKDGIAVSMCINGETLKLNDILIGVLSVLYDKPHNIASIPAAEPKKADVNRFSEYVGVYSAEGIPLTINIVREGDDLVARTVGQLPLMLEFVMEDNFRCLMAKAEMKFDVEQKKLLLKQGGQEIRLIRK